jgi:hypothetical protein
MGVPNLATVFAPGMLKPPPTSNENGDYLILMQNLGSAQTIVRVSSLSSFNLPIQNSKMRQRGSRTRSLTKLSIPPSLSVARCLYGPWLQNLISEYHRLFADPEEAEVEAAAPAAGLEDEDELGNEPSMILEEEGETLVERDEDGVEEAEAKSSSLGHSLEA